MFYKPVITLVISLTLAVSAMPATAQTAKAEAMEENVPALLLRANQSYASKDYETFRKTLEQICELRPNNSEYMYQLVIAYALLDEKRAAYDVMLRMQKQGLGYDFTLSDDTMNIRGTQVFDYVNDLMKIATEPTGVSEPVFVLPEDVILPEAINWHENRQKFLVGTIADGRIIAVGKDGQVEELLRADGKNGLWSIIDILVDQPRNRLWVTSASMQGFTNFDPMDKGRSALFEFNLETLELVRRYPVPVDGNPHILGNMVLGPDGSVFAADRVLPLIYKKTAGEDRLKPVLALKEMISQRGLAMQPDGRIMYVADREMGIMVVDVERQLAQLLRIPETLNLGGIDGLYLKDNALYVIQNGIKPQRVMRLQLDASGTKVDEIRPLAVAQPDFDLPSFGVIEGEDLYYFASSQGIGKASEPKAVKVLRTPLNAGGDLVQPDLQQFLRQQAEMNKPGEQKDKQE